jgi:hypothetical protein
MNPFLVIPACYVATAIIMANLQALAIAAWWTAELPELRARRAP